MDEPWEAVPDECAATSDNSFNVEAIEGVADIAKVEETSCAENMDESGCVEDGFVIPVSTSAASLSALCWFITAALLLQGPLSVQ